MICVYDIIAHIQVGIRRDAFALLEAPSCTTQLLDRSLRHASGIAKHRQPAARKLKAGSLSLSFGNAYIDAVFAERSCSDAQSCSALHGDRRGIGGVELMQYSKTYPFGVTVPEISEANCSVSPA